MTNPDVGKGCAVSVGVGVAVNVSVAVSEGVGVNVVGSVGVAVELSVGVDVEVAVGVGDGRLPSSRSISGSASCPSSIHRIAKSNRELGEGRVLFPWLRAMEGITSRMASS